MDYLKKKPFFGYGRLEDMVLDLNTLDHGIFCDIQMVKKNEVIHSLIHSNKSHFEIMFMNFPSKFTNFSRMAQFVGFTLCFVPSTQKSNIAPLERLGTLD